MITVNINGLTLCHKGSGGISHNTLPDVCKTPGEGVPVPYENEAYSSDLVKGTVSVFADGGNMIANVGSQFARSVFDEPGSMGGVRSGTNKAETDWISHSFDVFFEKKPACRLTDKLFMNHRNTVNMAGEQQGALAPPLDKQLLKEICEVICECKDALKMSFMEINLRLELFLSEVLGIDRSDILEFYNFNEYNNRQHCFAAKYNEEPYDEFRGGRAIDPSKLTEVPYEIYPPHKLIKDDGFFKRKTKGGATAPAGKTDALKKSRELGAGKVVIWDLVVLLDPTKEAELSNVKHIIEIKFEGDTATKNQQRARKEVLVQSKLTFIEEKRCGCKPDDDEDKESQGNVIKLLIILILLRGRKIPKIPGPRPRPAPVPLH